MGQREGGRQAGRKEGSKQAGSRTCAVSRYHLALHFQFLAQVTHTLDHLAALQSNRPDLQLTESSGPTETQTPQPEAMPAASVPAKLQGQVCFIIS